MRPPDPLDYNGNSITTPHHLASEILLMKTARPKPHRVLFYFLLCQTIVVAQSAVADEWKSGIKWLMPNVIDPGTVGGPPKDAIVLFDGKDMSAFEGGEKWKIQDGYVVSDKGGIATKQRFGSCQLHVEFASPLDDKDTGQGRGNSGVYFMGKYEVQILDSYKNTTYPDGQAAAIYKQSPPLVNVSRPPGEWQTYDIIFRAPKFRDDGSVAVPAALTVLHNGALVQDHFELKGSTAWDKPPAYEQHADKLPLNIQFHGDAVRFRNLWIRELGTRPRIEGGAPGAEPGAAKAVAATEPKIELLWPDGAPDAKGSAANDKPTLQIYLPAADQANGTSVVICPGGGYGHLAMGHEGRDIGHWLNSLGIAAFVCDYRHRGKGYGHPAPLQDASRAIRTVRARAAEFHVAADRIGILGFSAGGHLASTVATHFDAGDGDAKDAIQRVSSRPDFAVLCYAVIAFDEPFTHRGSQNNLLGADADKALVQQFSNEKQVTADTPPTFLWHTNEDNGVPPENSVAFYLAMRKAKVPAELHIYERGRHGLGLAKSVPGTADWSDRCAQWLRGRGLLTAAANQ